MHYRPRSSSNRVLLFAFAFLAMQIYVLYVSTFHMFHGMPPMCQLCATVKKYENSVAMSVVPLHAPFSIEDTKEIAPQQIALVSRAVYHPRAPPTLA